MTITFLGFEGESAGTLSSFPESVLFPMFWPMVAVAKVMERFSGFFRYDLRAMRDDLKVRTGREVWVSGHRFSDLKLSLVVVGDGL